jgi:hypothetical protein
MKTVTGKNNIVLVENFDGSFNEEIELDSNTSIVTGNEAHEFDTQEQLRTFIASINTAKFPTIPNVGEKCELNKVYAYGGDKVKCLQEHTRMHYTPEETPALWLIIPTVTEGYPEWKQPTGAHDAYQVGDRVSFNGNNYESKINANVWSPTVYPAGWLKL